MLSWLGRGILVGVAWGVTARIFMRLVSTDPEFSWSGTGAIVGMSALLWGGIGLVAGARMMERSRWWRLAPLPGLILFASPGMVLVPGAVGTAVAVALHGRPLVVRALPLLLGMGVTLAPAFVAGDGDGGTTPAPAWVGLALVVAATVWLGLGLHAWWRRWGLSEVPATSGGGPRTSLGPAAYDRG